MVEPKIVFCDYNHIYDAAIYSECPYCAKIKKEQEALNQTLQESLVMEEEYTEMMPKEEEDEPTEMIYREEGDEPTEMIHREEEDEPTEMIYREEEDEPTETVYREEEDEPTEMIYREEETETYEQFNPVLGWIVCNSGTQIGRSFEITSGKNVICVNSVGFIGVSKEKTKGKSIAEIIVDNTGKVELTVSEKVICQINNVSVNSKAEVRNYDTLNIGTYEFVFIAIMTEFVKWGT